MRSKFILLHPNDNVLVCCQYSKAGENISIENEKLVLINEIDLGHKVSRRNIKQGDKVIKYGVAIGSALQDIQPGEHIHFNNMKSDYISPHTREKLLEN